MRPGFRLVGRRDSGHRGGALLPEHYQGGPLDLADALGGDSPDLANVGQLRLTTVDQSVAPAYDVRRPLVQVLEHRVQPVTILLTEDDFIGTG